MQVPLRGPWGARGHASLGQWNSLSFPSSVPTAYLQGHVLITVAQIFSLGFLTFFQGCKSLMQKNESGHLGGSHPLTPALPPTGSATEAKHSPPRGGERPYFPEHQLSVGS